MSDVSSDAATPTVGFAGIGRMGLPMARNVLGAGFPLLVWNRTRERCRPLVEGGATAVAHARDLGAADVVVTMVADGSAARSVLVDSGLLDAMQPGSVVVEMSTIGPAAATELAEEAEKRGVGFVDAPVSGSVSVAEAAQLFVMAGGDRATYESVRSVLDAMTKAHMLVGPSGAGAAMKLAVNAMIAVTNESIGETLAFAERFGIDPAVAYDVLAGGALASPFVLYKRGAFLRPEDEPVAFTTALMLKDVTLALDLAEELGVPMHAASAAQDVLENAVAHGSSEADMASVYRLLRAPGTAPSPATSREES